MTVCSWQCYFSRVSFNFQFKNQKSSFDLDILIAFLHKHLVSHWTQPIPPADFSRLHEDVEAPDVCLCFRAAGGGGRAGGQQELHGAEWGAVRLSDGVSLADGWVLCTTGLQNLQPTRAHLLLMMLIYFKMFSILWSFLCFPFLFVNNVLTWQCFVLFFEKYKQT